ncbi:hypothetical protein DSECCO2_386900 [anaerobic digester metagenome]
MHADHSIHRRILQYPCLNHGQSPTRIFLTRLEQQLHAAVQQMPLRLQDLRRAQEHGRVAIMAAGMHPPIFRSKRQTGFFDNRQCVHICPQRDHRFVHIPPNQGHNGIAVHDRVVFDPKLIQDLLNIA